MDSLKDVLKKFNPATDKYISREFQSYGVHLAESLNDYKHKALYIKMSRDIPRPILERALSFCIDSNAKNKGALFMWKLKEMGVWKPKKKTKKDHPSNKNETTQ